MLARTIACAAVALMIAKGSVLACEGDELFADDFSDPSVSADLWPTKGDWFTIAKGYAQIKVERGRTGFAPIPSSQNEFDVCADIVFPEAKNTDGGTYGGFIFWW